MALAAAYFAGIICGYIINNPTLGIIAFVISMLKIIIETKNETDPGIISFFGNSFALGTVIAYSIN